MVKYFCRFGSELVPWVVGALTLAAVLASPAGAESSSGGPSESSGAVVPVCRADYDFNSGSGLCVRTVEAGSDCSSLDLAPHERLVATGTRFCVIQWDDTTAPISTCPDEPGWSLTNPGTCTRTERQSYQFQTGERQIRVGTERVRVQIGTAPVRVQTGTVSVRIQTGTERVRVQIGTAPVRVQTGTVPVRVAPFSRVVTVHVPYTYTVQVQDRCIRWNYQNGGCMAWSYRTETRTGSRPVTRTEAVFNYVNEPVYETRYESVYGYEDRPVYKYVDQPVYETRYEPVYGYENRPRYETVPVYETRYRTVTLATQPPATSCPEHYSLNSSGTQCLRTMTKQVDATAVCPSNAWTLSGWTCSHTTDPTDCSRAGFTLSRIGPHETAWGCTRRTTTDESTDEPEEDESTDESTDEPEEDESTDEPEEDESTDESEEDESEDSTTTEPLSPILSYLAPIDPPEAFIGNVFGADSCEFTVELEEVTTYESSAFGDVKFSFTCYNVSTSNPFGSEICIVNFLSLDEQRGHCLRDWGDPGRHATMEDLVAELSDIELDIDIGLDGRPTYDLSLNVEQPAISASFTRPFSVKIGEEYSFKQLIGGVSHDGIAPHANWGSEARPFVIKFSIRYIVPPTGHGARAATATSFDAADASTFVAAREAIITEMSYGPPDIVGSMARYERNFADAVEYWRKQHGLDRNIPLALPRALPPDRDGMRAEMNAAAIAAGLSAGLIADADPF